MNIQNIRWLVLQEGHEFSKHAERERKLDMIYVRELADALIQVQKRYDPGEDRKAKEQARAVLPMLREEFYRTYEQVVLEIISKHNTTISSS